MWGSATIVVKTYVISATLTKRHTDMPYRQILWIKLERRLLNDYRFYTLSPDSQRLYPKLLLLAGETNNKIPKNLTILRSSLRETLEEGELLKCLNEIKTNFPKFKEGKHLYHFLGFSQRHNQVIPGISLGYAGATLDKNRIDKIRTEYARLKGYALKDLSSDDYGRTGRAIKTLIGKAKGNDQLVIDSLNWASRKKWCDYTLETIIKKWADFMAEEGNLPENLRRHIKK